MASRHTTALREPWNYGLRGWISTRSNDLARVLSEVDFLGTSGWPFVRADRAAFFAIRRECLGTYSRERVRHEDVEWPDGSAIAGVDGGGHDARGRRGGFRGAAPAVGNHVAGSRYPGDGKHHQLP